MAVRVIEEKCKGCKSCVEICPGDLMAFDEERNKSYLRSERDCWDCMSCVKECPSGAIISVLSFQLSDRGAMLIPSIQRNYIKWSLKDSSGNVEEFIIKILEEVREEE